jgi:hypothetical protein
MHYTVSTIACFARRFWSPGAAAAVIRTRSAQPGGWPPDHFASGGMNPVRGAGTARGLHIEA